MKRFFIICGIILLAVLAVKAFYNNETSITGRVSPVDGANIAWAISSKDSATSNIVNGSFSLPVKPGTYRVMIDALAPYKDATVENVVVKEGQTADVGEIILQRQIAQPGD